jgi:CrcB protein
MKLLFIAFGGAVGALLRFTVSGLTYSYVEGDFPWGTLIVNFLGCLGIGAGWQVSERFLIGPYTRDFVFIGVLGAFTTFSTFGLETFSLIRDREIKFAILNIAVSNTFGILAVFAGFFISRYILNFYRG